MGATVGLVSKRDSPFCLVKWNGTWLKGLAARMPPTWQLELKRRRYRRQIAQGAFFSGEPEDALLDSLLGEGDWAIDVGANIGHYTKRMSDLVERMVE